jgi:ABC-type transport system involved in multi-copper enzyme maturation permease subunit
MTNLLRSEIRRLAGRRMLFWLLLAILALSAFIIVIVAIRSDSDSFNPGDAMSVTQLWLTSSAARHIGVQRDQTISSISVLTYLLVIVIGASAVGADYRAGTVVTLLTWEPRRARLLIARFVATALVSMAFFLIIQLVFIGGWTLAAQLFGRSRGVDAAFWGDLAVMLARATVLAGVLAVISAAIATVGRNTAAAMGVWFGYLIAIEVIVRGQILDLVPWFVITNAAAFFSWERLHPGAGADPVSPVAGTLRLALYFAVFAGAAILVFRRRDVT